MVFKASYLDTPLGQMIAVADEQSLCLLEFTDCPGLQWEMDRFPNVVPGQAQPILSIQKELKAYFEGTLKEFKTPLSFWGTAFQKRVWQQLQKIPHGKTWSYSELAQAVGQPTACRAVAQANGANQLAIVVPCHRVINKDASLGGYAGGVARKTWLLNHEGK